MCQPSKSAGIALHAPQAWAQQQAAAAKICFEPSSVLELLDDTSEDEVSGAGPAAGAGADACGSAPDASPPYLVLRSARRLGPLLDSCCRHPPHLPQSGFPLQSPAAAPCLMDLTLVEVAVAARAAAPLGAATAALLRGLFPSAAGLSACVPSADGLGYTVATLLPPPSPHQQAAELAELLQPLACGGQLAFTLAGAPGGAERQIMAAFAASLSDRLAVRRAPCQVSSAHRRGAWDWAALPTSLPAAAANIPHPPPPSPPPASCRSPPRCSGRWTLRLRLTKPAPCPLTASG